MLNIFKVNNKETRTRSLAQFADELFECISPFDILRLGLRRTKGINYFSLRALYKELIWCTNYSNVHIHILTLGSDDMTVFKCFRVIFFLKKQTIQFSSSLNLYFQQKIVRKLSICHLLPKRSVSAFDVTDRRYGFYNFQRYH